MKEILEKNLVVLSLTYLILNEKSELKKNLRKDFKATKSYEKEAFQNEQ